MIESGTYQVDGTLVFGGGGEFRFDGGEFIHNGVIIWNLAQYGPHIYINSSNYTDNGKIYLRDNRGKDDNPSNSVIDERCVEISMAAINSYN